MRIDFIVAELSVMSRSWEVLTVGLTKYLSLGSFYRKAVLTRSKVEHNQELQILCFYTAHGKG